MAVVNWTENNRFINNATPLIEEVLDSGDDWLHFLDALGKVEGNDDYNTQNTQGYIGIYQFAPFSNPNSIFYDLGFSNNIGGMLGATTNAAYKANPIAQELSAIMEFSGIPDITQSFYSKYGYVRNAAPWAGLSKSNLEEH